ncbi:MAG TPA: hypothetical protein PK299_07210 [Anaerolineales bacterium]|nr:hypothetical protein [Anaerolineales bacterium]
MNKTKNDISTHIDSLPDEFRQSVRQLDKVISEMMAGYSRVLWEGTLWGGTSQEIIGYGDYTINLSRGKKSEWFMVGLAVQKNYISIYVNAFEDQWYVAEKYRSQLGKVKIGKSSISFKQLDDLNMETLKKVLSIARDSMPKQPSA